MNDIPAALRRLVVERAQHGCEYCLLPNGVSFFSHEVDHIIAKKHGGVTTEENLTYACWRCNRHKGTDLGSFDPATGAFSVFFHPRTQQWADHFVLQGALVVGLTAEARTTLRLFQINTEERLAERQRLIDHQLYPPASN
jgi:hypothetical protein